MKHLNALLLIIVSAMSIFLCFELNIANQEIVNLNSQVSAFEVQAGRDTDKIKALENALLKRSHSKKKVICWDLNDVA